MRNVFILALGLVLVSGLAGAAETRRWKTQEACEAAVHAQCTHIVGSGWQIAVASKPETPVAATTATATGAALPQAVVASKPPEPVVPSPQPQVVKEEKSEGFFSKIFGKKASEAKKPDEAVHEVVSTPAPVVNPDVERAVEMKKPEMQKPAADPEQVLRGKVWTSESACKKEALKGSCFSIDCATHTGGACSGYTSMIWMYR